MNGKAFLACVLMSVVLTGCETAKKISQVIRNPDIQVGKLMDQSTELTVTLLTEPDSNLTADGEEGLHKARAWNYDAIVLDLMLPKRDGWSLLAELRGERSTPVLILSARDGVDDRVQGEGGADSHSELTCADRGRVTPEGHERVVAAPVPVLVGGDPLPRRGDREDGGAAGLHENSMFRKSQPSGSTHDASPGLCC